LEEDGAFVSWRGEEEEEMILKGKILKSCRFQSQTAVVLLQLLLLSPVWFDVDLLFVPPSSSPLLPAFSRP
jgi:hypothetical protein